MWFLIVIAAGVWLDVHLAHLREKRQEQWSREPHPQHLVHSHWTHVVWLVGMVWALIYFAGCGTKQPERQASTPNVVEAPRQGTLEYLDAKNGFRDLTFGSWVAVGMQFVNELDGLKVFSRPSDDLRIGAGRAEAILYGFYEGKLARVGIVTRGRSNSWAVREVLIEAYGSGTSWNSVLANYHGPNDPDNEITLGDILGGFARQKLAQQHEIRMAVINQLSEMAKKNSGDLWWNGRRIHLFYSEDNATQDATITFTSVEIQHQRDADEKTKTKKGVGDL